MSNPTLKMIPTKKVVAGENPRGAVDTKSASFEELCASIEARGILQPILVGPSNGNGKHTVIAGHRRHAAATELKVAEIPAMVLDLEGAELIAALTENIQREDLSPVAEAEALKELQDRHDFNQVQAGDALGKSERWVRERLRLLTLPEGTQAAYDKKVLPLESLVPVQKIAKQAPKVAEAIASAAGKNVEVRKAVGADRLPDVLQHLNAEAKRGEDGVSELGCLIQIAGPRHRYPITFDQVAAAGAPAEVVEGIEAKIAEGRKLEKKVRWFSGHLDQMWADVGLTDEARAFGCLLEIEGASYVTDAAWIADRFVQHVDHTLTGLEKQVKDEGVAPAPAPDKKPDPDQVKAEKEERRRQREAEAQARADARAANLEMGQRALRALRAPKLSLEEAQLLAMLVIGRSSSDLAARGLVYCYHEYQEEEDQKVGVKVTYATGKSAGTDLLAAVKAQKKPEEALGLALRAVLLASFTDQDCVAPSSQSYFHPRQETDADIDALLDKIATKRKILPDAIRERVAEEQREEAEAAERALLEQAKSSRAKKGYGRKALLALMRVSEQHLSDAIDSKYLKPHDGDEEESYTITAAGAKRLEKLQAAAKERQAV